ncbi:MAG: hypothetical protein AAGA48_12045 [Myxococcota bacterium]
MASEVAITKGTSMMSAWLLGGGALLGTGAVATLLGYLAQVVCAWAGVPLG